MNIDKYEPILLTYMRKSLRTVSRRMENMRISGNQNMEITAKSFQTATVPKAASSARNVANVVEQGSDTTKPNVNFTAPVEDLGAPLDDSEETKKKVQDAVSALNEFLEVNYSTSKFFYHEGLDRYYVSVVDKETQEIVKEIPPRKLLDAFYEMQKMVGMIVDEKI